MRISASRLEVWMSCPLQAKFQYLDKLPRRQHASATFGSAVHHALQKYNEGFTIEQAIDEFNYVWSNPETINSVPDVWAKNTSMSSLRTRGITILKGYHEKVRWQTREVLATEHSFVVPFGEFELIGIVDLVEFTKDEHGLTQLRITDYKTSKRQPYLNTLPWNTQFTIYVYAAMQPEFWLGHRGTKPVKDAGLLWPKIDGMVPKAYWYHLEGLKDIYVGPRSDADFMRLYRACKEIQRADEYGVYVPNISGDSCGFCSYHDPCGLPIPQETLFTVPED